MLDDILDHARTAAMRLIVQFTERTGIPIPELIDAAKPKLAAFTSDITGEVATTANRMRPRASL